jgi:hypothetical protein
MTGNKIINLPLFGKMSNYRAKQAGCGRETVIPPDTCKFYSRFLRYKAENAERLAAASASLLK